MKLDVHCATLWAMSIRDSEHCYHCSGAAEYDDSIPNCPEHGPLWLLRRNGPSASAIITRRGQILLRRRAREPWLGHWETPGGYVDEGEHPADAVRREVQEELGLLIEDVVLFDVFVDEWSPDQWAQNTVYVTSPGVAAVRTDPREVAGWGWFPLEELPTPMAIGQADRIATWHGKQLA